MAGISESLTVENNVECKASANIVNIEKACYMTMSQVHPHAVASASMTNVEAACIMGVAKVQSQVVAANMMNAGKEECIMATSPVHPQEEAVVNMINMADLGKVYSTQVHPHRDAPLEDVCESFQLVSMEGECCNHASGYLGLEEGTNMCDTQFNKKVEVCAICHDKIKVEETAQIRGCEHSYCVTCILRWASYKTEPWCPQCRLPFSFLYVYRALDGTLSDYMFEESVCLLLRAFWFKPLTFQDPEEQDDYQDDYDVYEEPYYTSNVRLGNRRWGDSGYVRGGRREARPVGVRQVADPDSIGGSSSRQAKGKEPAKEAVGRRARRAQKREQIDKMVGKKQQVDGKYVATARP